MCVAQAKAFKRRNILQRRQGLYTLSPFCDKTIYANLAIKVCINAWANVSLTVNFKLWRRVGYCGSGTH